MIQAAGCVVTWAELVAAGDWPAPAAAPGSLVGQGVAGRQFAHTLGQAEAEGPAHVI